MRLRIALLFAFLPLLACPPPPSTPDSGGTGAPTVTAVTPSSGPVTGGTVVSLSGTNFADGAQVKFGAVAADQVQVGSSTLISARSPSVPTPGVVAVTVTNSDGTSGFFSSAFTFTAVNTTRIAEAVLMNPADANDASGATTIKVTVIGQVEVPTVTPGQGQGLGVWAQAGFATSVSSPPSVADFTWTDAAYFGDADGPVAGDLARDVYHGDVSVPGATGSASVVYSLAMRFSIDNGVTWKLADRDGTANGVQAAQLAKLTVTPSSVDWCKLGGEAIEAPPSVTLRSGALGPVVFGQVYKLDVTTHSDVGPGIKGQLGYGLAGTDPEAWTWVDAGYNKDTGGGSNDEYMASLPNPGDAGSYLFAFRFNADDGPWAYCDADGLANGGFTEAQAGQVTVSNASPIDGCVLQFPSAIDARTGRPAGTVYGRVFATGITDGTAQSSGVEAQLGYGPGADLPTAGTWTWTPATYNLKVSGGGEEYQASLTGPAAGSWAYAYRFRYQQGAWTVCDLDGSANGFSAAQAGQLTVKPFDVDSCELDTATGSQATTPGSATANILGRVTALTLTEASGQGAGITAELGTGAVGTTPSSWTTWTPATFDQDANSADQYRATLTAPATLGSYEVAYRFKLGSNPYVYCDKDGSANGYSSAQAGRLTVATAVISACKLQWVDHTAAHSGDAVTGYVRILVPGVSSVAGATPGLRAQFGVGTQGVNASTSPGWGWKEAAFSSDIAESGEDEFSLIFFPAYTGTRAVAARASLDDGVTWIYCDSDGSANGYDPANQWGISIDANVDFGWCNTQFPTTASTDAGTVIYGRAYKSGVTPDARAPITAELGLGRENEDPGMAWRWQSAAFNVSPSDSSNEYQSTLQVDAGAIGLSYAYRFTTGGGGYCYGDLNASADGFSGTSGGNPNLGVVVP